MLLQKKHILAIDDTISIRTFLRISLQACGAEFSEAGSAEEGLKLCESFKPDLVVLDLGLPDKDGLEILPTIKQSLNEYPTPKVIILSVRHEQHIKDQAYSLGADAYLTKPFMIEDLIELIERTLVTTKG